jgi:hypothetical protein
MLDRLRRDSRMLIQAAEMCDSASLEQTTAAGARTPETIKSGAMNIVSISRRPQVRPETQVVQ